MSLFIAFTYDMKDNGSTGHAEARKPSQSSAVSGVWRLKERFMADIIDLSQSQESMEIQTALRQALAPPAGCEMGPIWEDGKAYCRRCDSIIPTARLKAMPGTGLCVDCAAIVQEGPSRATH